MKKKRHITRAKKAKVSEILTDSSHASSHLWRSARSADKAQKKMRQELGELRSRFKGITARGPVPFIVVDAEGYIREVNEAGCKLLDAASDQLVSLSFGFLVYPADVGLWRKHVRYCRERGSDPVITELRIRLRDRRVLYVQLISNFFHRDGVDLFQTVLIDQTERMTADSALRRDQIMLARAEALAHVGSWEWDIHKDALVWSDELYRIFGVERDKFPCNFKAFLDLIHPEDRERVERLIRKAVHDAAPLDFQHRIIRAGDGVRVLRCQGYFILDACGRPEVLLGTAQDITELRAAEEKLRATNRDLEERTRSLESSHSEMQAFSYSIAHDLRAPLRAIQGMSRILMEDYYNALDKDGQDYFGRIMDAAQRMDDLIRDLLDYARMTTVQLPIEPVDGEAVWARVFANFATEVRDKDAVVTKDETLPSVLAHRTVVELALSNLLGNALKFFPKGGKPEIRVWTERLEDRVRFNVEDKGIGIAPEHQQRIFRVFERLHPADAYPGTGIGLAIVKKGVERLGGAVGLDSKPGVGSTFWFELPAVD